jgi:hypothetical protein
MRTQVTPCSRNSSETARKMSDRVLGYIVQDPPVGPAISCVGRFRLREGARGDEKDEYRSLVQRIFQNAQFIRPVELN